MDLVEFAQQPWKKIVQEVARVWVETATETAKDALDLIDEKK